METYVSGTISVKAVLEERRRSVQRLIVNPKKRSRDIAYLIAISKQQNIPVEFLSGDEMKALAADNGGVIALCGEYDIPHLEDAKLLQGLCVYISGVEDPYNLGSIARTLYAAGASMMIIHQRDWSGALATLLRSSAGAWERLPIYSVADDQTMLDLADRAALPLICAARDESAVSLFESALPQNCLLAIGGAMRGLSSAILHADGTHLYIPYGRAFRNALDSVGAAAVFAFSWTRTYGIEMHESTIQEPSGRQ